MPFRNYDVYIEADGVTKGLLILGGQDGMRQYQVALAPTFAPQQRLDANNLYEGQPPEVTITSATETWHGGAGKSDGTSGGHNVDGHATAGYNYSRNLDLSDEHRVYLSPFRNVTVTDEVDTLFDGTPLQFIDTSLGFFAITTNAIYKWSTSSLSWEVKDSSGSYIGGAIEHDGYIYVPRGTSPYVYSSNGSTWTASNRSTTLGQANSFCNRGDDGEASATYNVIVRLRDNEVSVSTDGLNSGAAWSTADEIGPTNQTATFITPDVNNVVIWKREGVYLFDFSNVDNFWSASYVKDDNASYVYQWADGLFYANYGDSVLQFDFANSTITHVYPPAGTDSPEIVGAITGIDGDDAHLYVTVQNANGVSYVMKGKPGAAFHTLAFHRSEQDSLLPVGTGSNNASIGTIAWTNPTNIQTLAYATATAGTSQYLVADNFGFAIPSDAVIQGITATIYRSAVDPAVTLDASESGAPASPGATVTWSHTVTAQSNRALLVGISYDNANSVAATGVTYSGVAMSLVQRKQLDGYSYYDTATSTTINVSSTTITDIWSLTAPVSGANNVVVTFNAAPANNNFPLAFPYTWAYPFNYISASFYNVDQTTPFGSIYDASTSSSVNNSASIGFNVDPDDYSVAFATMFGASSVSTANTAVETPSNNMLLVAEQIATSPETITVTKVGDGTLYLAGFVVNELSSSSVSDNSVRLLKNGSFVGENLASTTPWTSVNDGFDYGGKAYTWGTGWTYADINDADFGVAVSAVVADSTARVNYITIDVYYSVAQDSHSLKVVAPGTLVADNPAAISGYGNSSSYFILPNSNARPEDDSNYRFQTGEEAYVVGSWTDFGGAAYSKFLNRGTLFTDNTTSGKSVVLSYELNDGTEADIVTAKQNGLSASNITGKVEFNQIRYIVNANTTSSDTSPTMLGWTLQATLNQPRYRMWTLVVDLSNQQSMMDGNSDYFQDSIDLEDFLFAATQKRPVFTDVLGRRYNVRISDLTSLGYKNHVQGEEERIGMTYQIRLLEIGPLSSETSALVYGSGAWGRERDWS